MNARELRCGRCGGRLDAADVLFTADGGTAQVRCEPPAARCALCQMPIVREDEIARVDGNPVHEQCRDRASPGILVVAYIARQPGVAFCHTCLGARLGLGWEIVRKLIWSLRASPGFDVRPATCAACGGSRVTIAALTPTPH
jgi:hypothetical protein